MPAVEESTALGYLPGSEDPPWTAAWIWLDGDEYTVNVHLQARKQFDLQTVPQRAALRISAYTDYILYVNGRHVGRGPEWNDPDYQTYDVYDLRTLLRTGANVISVIPHNYAIGTHWSRRNRGGLIAQLDCEGVPAIGTDATWKIKRGEAWLPNSPRIFWSAGFLETFDFHRYDSRWLEAGFDDSSWQAPLVIGKHPSRPWIRLLRRQIPLLEETLIAGKGVEKGHAVVPPFHAVSFEKILPPGQAGIVHAQTTILSRANRTLLFRVECDDAFQLTLNGAQVASFQYDEYFARTRLWNGKDEYDQVHYGMGTIRYSQSSGKPMYGEVTPGALELRPGDNELELIVDQGPGGWGAMMSFLDSVTLTPTDIEFRANEKQRHWVLSGPFESTGLSDSLEQAKRRVVTASAAQKLSYSPFDYACVTDYAMLMNAERRSGIILDGNRTALGEHEYAIFDLERVHAGFPEIEFKSSEGGTFDIGYTQILTPDRRVRLAAYGSMRYVDRVMVTGGKQVWQPFDRRTARYLHVVCREGQAEVKLNGFSAIGYPVRQLGSFECSDELLNSIWETSVYTARLLMQQGYQDCLKREQGTLNTSSFNYTSRGAAYTFGDYGLARKNLVQALRTQDRTGWFDSHGVSSPNSDEPTECFWWAVWLRDYYQQSGDLDLVRELFEGLEDNLRYFTKGINRFGIIEGGNRPIFWRGQGIYIDDSAETGKYDGVFDGELVGLNQLYAAALNAAAYLASELHLPQRSQVYERRAKRVEIALHDRFWDQEKGLFRDWRLNDDLSLTYHPIFQITALYFNLVRPEAAPRLLHFLTEKLGLPDENKPNYPLTTFGYYYYFLDILFRKDFDAKALELMRRFYGRWLELGATTFGEFFRLADWKGKSMLDTEYEVHAYGVSALTHFYSSVLGIRPQEPGFRKVSIAPHPGDLLWAKGQLSTPQGLVKVSWQADHGAFQIDVNLPGTVSFEFHAPQGFSIYKLAVNGKSVDLV